MKNKLLSLLVIFSLVIPLQAKDKKSEPAQNDRTYWCELLYRIAESVLSNMSRGELKKNMVVELSPNWPKGRNMQVTYLDTFGRLMDGIAPWLSLPDDETPERKQRLQLCKWALASYKNAVDPQSPDFLKWKGEHPIQKPFNFDLVLRRMQRFNVLLERMISPEGTYPAIGRSITYRLGAFQSLGLAAWKYGLPKSLSKGQVRSALTAVMKRMFDVEGNFNESGFLQLGFVGHQPNLADYYTNNGSLYMTALGFLPLGLPANHPFWTDPAEDWTSKKAWSGHSFPKDYYESLRK